MVQARNNGNSKHKSPPPSARDVAIGGRSETGHFVQFYEADEFLLDSLGSFVSAGLSADDACIVVATKERREGLEVKLRDAGLDVSAMSTSGRYVSLDAAETLSSFTINGEPSPDRFNEVIGGIILRASEGHRRVRIFGEMVALLLAEGNAGAAIRLEKLWNDLAEIHPFLLFCAYPINGFGGESLASAINDVCATHTRVIPAESYAALLEEDARAREITRLQQKALTLESEIAERRRAQEVLRQREAELTDFVENAMLGLHWVGPDGIIQWANRAEMELLGYAPEEYIGHNIAEFHADREVINDIINRLTRGEELHNYEARLKCKDGSIRYVLISSNVYRENGEFIHTRCFTRDITERKLAEDALREAKAEVEAMLAREQMARAEAETASRMKDEFLATVSHELRTPLTAIMGWAHMLHQGRLDKETAARAVETIERNATAQAQLVEDILDVSRVITGKLRLNVGAVDLAAVINAAIDSVQLAADSKNIQMEVTLSPSARRIQGDASRLQQVVWNLLSNAIKFTPKGGRVYVRLERAGSNAQIRVSDTGCGISEDFLPFIFDRFRQADGTTTRRHGGLGLGLAIVRHLVELHGGKVSAASDGEGAGTTFTILLPLATDGQHTKENRRDTSPLPANVDDNRRTKPLPSIDGVRVLLVENDADTLQVLTAMLLDHKAKVHAVSSVTDALEAIVWYTPDVLVSDLAMPEEDGYSLIARLRATDAANGGLTPAIAVTSYVRVEDRVRALSAGFNMFVPKPVEVNELVTAIASLAETGAM